MNTFATTALAGAFALLVPGAVLAQGGPAAPGGAQTQPSPSAPRFSPDQVRQGLTALGYTDVSIVSQDGGAYLAKAKKEGRDVTLLVDPAGQVQERAGG